jgi:hypothetical protein
MKTLFWLSSGLLAYAFVGYPLLLEAGSRLVRRTAARRAASPDVSPAAPSSARPSASMAASWHSAAQADAPSVRPSAGPSASSPDTARVIPDADLPTVSVLLSVFDEEAVIERKILNFLALDYPAERIELCVVSDGCTDATESIVARYAGQRVRLVRQEARGGKTRALNRAAAEARGDVLVFTDANAMFRPDCVRRLAERLADPGVGLVSGVSVYVDASGDTTAGGVYRRYEEWIKSRESDLFSIVGADGAAYAMRRALYTPLAPEYINDLLHPVQVLLAGSRAVSEPRAVVEEEADAPAASPGSTQPGSTSSGGRSSFGTSPGVQPGPQSPPRPQAQPDSQPDTGAEMRRQTRIMAQSWLICLRQLPVLVRRGCWGFVWQMLSHKVLRWATLPLLAVCAVSAVALVPRGMPYALAAAALAGGGLLAWAGARGLGDGRGWGGHARTAWLFVVLHAAAVNGLYRLLRGQTFVTWTPRGD